MKSLYIRITDREMLEDVLNVAENCWLYVTPRYQHHFDRGFLKYLIFDGIDNKMSWDDSIPNRIYKDEYKVINFKKFINALLTYAYDHSNTNNGS